MEKLLKSSPLTRNEIFVRETLQNSWDAKETGTVPLFEIRLHRVSKSSQNALKNQVFADIDARILPNLAESLDRETLFAIEANDRDTTGLLGPDDPTLPQNNDTPTNFIDLVHNIGASKDDLLAGGSFGYGKTSAFNLSHCHTVIYWSVTPNTPISASSPLSCESNDRLREDRELEHRLIAVSYSDEYNDDDRRYTGLHWWGSERQGSNDNPSHVSALRGDTAKSLAETIFRSRFEPGQTGTSLLIIDPLVKPSLEDSSTDDSHGASTNTQKSTTAQNDANEGTDGFTDDEGSSVQYHPIQNDSDIELFKQQTRSTLIKNAWPKVIPTSDLNRRMRVTFMIENEIDEWAKDIQNHFAPFSYCLNRIREEQDQLPVDNPDELIIVNQPEKPIPIRIRRSGALAEVPAEKGAVVGHLHIIQVVAGSDNLYVKANSVCLLRHRAELVVNFREPQAVTDYNIPWFAVFKPMEAFDGYFADSEPATHHDWMPENAHDSVAQEVVRRALKTIDTKVRDFLDAEAKRSENSEFSSKLLSRKLRSLLPDDPEIFEDLNSLKPGRRKRRSVRRRQQQDPVTITSVDRNMNDPALQIRRDCYTIKFETLASHMDNDESTLRPDLILAPKLSAVTEEGEISLEDDEYELKWYRNRLLTSTNMREKYPVNEEGVLQVSVPKGLRLIFEMSVENE